MSKRKTVIKRKTKETEIHLEIDLDNSGEIEISTQIPFLNHLLCSMAFHGSFNLLIKGKGDIEVDLHHSIEDTGIVLGSALYKILSEHDDIARFGHSIIPMDDSLSEVVIDVCGRSYLVYNVSFPQSHIGVFDTSLLNEFFTGLVGKARIALHAHVRYGKNSHHMAESLFKAFGMAIKQAYTQKVTRGGQPSTKGLII